MDSRKLQRTASHVRKEGMGEHPLQWLRADMWADYRRVAPADYNSEMSEAELQHMIKNARETWARAHKDWTPEGDGEIAPHACSEREPNQIITGVPELLGACPLLLPPAAHKPVAAPRSRVSSPSGVSTVSAAISEPRVQQEAED